MPFDLLFTIIENGALNERITALRYLSDKPNKNSIQQIIKLTSFVNPLREIASRILYEIYLRTWSIILQYLPGFFVELVQNQDSRLKLFYRDPSALQ